MSVSSLPHKVKETSLSLAALYSWCTICGASFRAKTSDCRRNTLESIAGKQNYALGKLNNVAKFMEDSRNEVSKIARANSAAIEAGRKGFNGGLRGRLFG